MQLILLIILLISFTCSKSFAKECKNKVVIDVCLDNKKIDYFFVNDNGEEKSIKKNGITQSLNLDLNIDINNKISYNLIKPEINKKDKYLKFALLGDNVNKQIFGIGFSYSNINLVGFPMSIGVNYSKSENTILGIDYMSIIDKANVEINSSSYDFYTDFNISKKKIFNMNYFFDLGVSYGELDFSYLIKKDRLGVQSDLINYSENILNAGMRIKNSLKYKINNNLFLNLSVIIGVPFYTNENINIDETEVSSLRTNVNDDFIDALDLNIRKINVLISTTIINYNF